ncbi:MAG: acyltransferase [Deltaproteobacteria bacterium]|nr:acyltransferase [Deltaproteobacteria bacterium]
MPSSFLNRSISGLAEIAGRLWSRFTLSTLGMNALSAFRSAYWQSRLASFGEGSHIYPNVVINSPEKVRIGRRVNIVNFVHMWGGGGIEIGDNTIIASHVVITSQTHDKYSKIFRDSNKMAPVIIGRNCWIGSGAIILPGVSIGEGCVIGAQAVVTKDIEPRSVIVGVPARLLEKLK